MNTVLAGIRPTSKLHIGNYLGVVKGMLELQKDPTYFTFYMVADLHAITTPYNADRLKDSVHSIVTNYLAAGLDPEKSTLFVQSMVPQHAELAFLLSTAITVARMRHLPTFKEKVKQHPDHVTMALLNYPILMAADILAYKANKVPVGADQAPHIEVSREIARKMNAIYGTTFPEPEMYSTKGASVPSLTGEGKMSKSVEGSHINLVDDFDTIKSCLARMPTDSGKGNRVPDNGPVANLLKFVELFQGVEQRKEYESIYTTSGIRYKDLKENLASAIHTDLEPFQTRHNDLSKKPAFVKDVISDGAKKAAVVAEKTLSEVKEKMGF